MEEKTKDIIKTIFWIAIIIIMIGSTIASAMAFITPDNLNITSFVGFQEQKTLTFRNNFTSTIFNVTCQNTSEFQYTIIPEMLANENRDLIMSYKTTTPYQPTLKPQTCFYLLKTEVLKEIRNASVSLDQSGWNQTNIQINQDDILYLNNPQSNQRTISEINFNQYYNQLNQNSTITFSTPTIGTYRLVDSFSSHVLYVYVNNRSGFDYLRNNANDRIMNLTIESLYKATSLNLEIFTNNFSISVAQTKQGTGRITNNGQFPASDITLMGNNWISFSISNLSLNSNQEKIFTFDINPKNINQSSQTNISYSIPITLTSPQVGTINSSINVFVEYAQQELLNANGTNIRLVPDIFVTKQMCMDEPIGTEKKALCIKMSLDIINNSGNIDDFLKDYVKVERLMLAVNYTGEELLQIKMATKQTPDLMNRIANYLGDTRFDIAGMKNETIFALNAYKEIITQQNASINECRAEQREDRDTLWTFIIIFIMIILILFTYLAIPFIKEKMQDWELKEKGKKV